VTDHVANSWTDKPTVAVIPFANQSGSQDQDQDILTDGLTEDIITDLSRISGLWVIARQSSFAYKGEDIDIQKIGRELRAGYLLQGSVRRSNDRVRVNASLIDVEKGTNMWANRYDYTLKDAFELQDEVTRTIVAALAVSLTSEEERYLESSRQVNQDAYEILLRGLQGLRSFSAEGNLLARQYFEQAIELDPDYARAHANLALTYVREVVFLSGEPRQDSIRKAIEIADHAESLDDRHSQNHFARAVAYQASSEHEAAVTASCRSIELDPNNADGHILLANSLLDSGEFDEAWVEIGKARLLNPRYPFSYLGIEGQYYFLTRRFEQAASAFEESLERNPGYPFGRMYLVASYGHLGRIGDAS
jgi:adenylate cyclase